MNKPKFRITWILDDGKPFALNLLPINLEAMKEKEYPWDPITLNGIKLIPDLKRKVLSDINDKRLIKDSFFWMI